MPPAFAYAPMPTRSVRIDGPTWTGENYDLIVDEIIEAQHAPSPVEPSLFTQRQARQTITVHFSPWGTWCANSFRAIKDARLARASTPRGAQTPDRLRTNIAVPKSLSFGDLVASFTNGEA